MVVVALLSRQWYATHKVAAHGHYGEITTNVQQLAVEECRQEEEFVKVVLHQVFAINVIFDIMNVIKLC